MLKITLLILWFTSSDAQLVKVWSATPQLFPSVEQCEEVAKELIKNYPAPHGVVVKSICINPLEITT
jgi:hypothetical protein